MFDELAIRKAADNPAGRQRIALPRLAQLEDLPDPKQVLHELLRGASGRTGGRRRRMRVPEAVHRLAGLIDDFSPLFALPAFDALRRELRQVIANQRWTDS